MTNFESLLEYDKFIEEKYHQLESIYNAEESLHEFIKQSWSHIEGKTPFIDGWHIGAICEHLEALSKREIKNLLINIPPRCTKSSLVSVMFPAWRWINDPSEQFLYASYAASLSLRDSVKCRRLILSDWYQKRWGDVFQLVGDQNTKGRFDNNQKGYRIASSSGSSVTGEGGSVLVCDDPNNAKDGESEAKRTATLDWWDQVWSTRLNNPKTGVRLVVQQRLHESDVSGHIMKNDVDEEWIKLILPMEFEKIRKSITVILPSTRKNVWEDPRKEEGELLWPERIGQKELNTLKVGLGSQYNISGQLQQRPSPEGGGIIKKNWFQWWKQESPPHLVQTIQSWDTALEAGKENAYSACTTWGVFYNDHHIPNVMLLNMWRGKLEYPDLRKMVKRLYMDYRDDGSNDFSPSGKHRPDIILVEAKASGSSLMQDLIRLGISPIPFNPTKHGDKNNRVHIITHLLEAGRVWLPARPPDYERLRTFADIFVEECAKFPKDDSRDLVDTMTQVLIRLSSSGWITNPDDNREIETENYKKQVFY